MSRNPALDLPKSQMYRDMAALGFYDLEGWTMVRNEMRAYQYGFQTMLELNDRVREDWWPLTCSRERLEEWEGLLALPPRPLETRVAWGMGGRAFWPLVRGGGGLRGGAALLAAVGLEGEIREDFPARRLTVRITGLGEGYQDPGPSKARLRGLVPAHLALVFEDARGG